MIAAEEFMGRTTALSQISILAVQSTRISNNGIQESIDNWFESYVLIHKHLTQCTYHSGDESRNVVLFNKLRVPNSYDFEEKNTEGECNSTLDVVLKERIDNRTAFLYRTLILKGFVLPIEADFISIKMGHTQMTELSHVNRKVLPLCDLNAHDSTELHSAKESSKKNSRKEEEKRRSISKMKELLRWTAATNSEKGSGSKRWKVLYFRNRGALNYRGDDDDELFSGSSNLSLKHDVGSCSASYVYSPRKSEPMITRHSSLPSAKDSISTCNVRECTKIGSWITTDSDCKPLYFDCAAALVLSKSSLSRCQLVTEVAGVGLSYDAEIRPASLFLSNSSIEISFPSSSFPFMDAIKALENLQFETMDISFL